MTGLIGSMTVTVIRPVETGRDELNEPVYGEPEREEVAGCLVTPGASSDLDERRPYGVRVACTLHLPKSYAGSLRGCQVEVSGRAYRTIGGDPVPYMAENTPGPWDRAIGLEAVDG